MTRFLPRPAGPSSPPPMPPPPPAPVESAGSPRRLERIVGDCTHLAEQVLAILGGEVHPSSLTHPASAKFVAHWRKQAAASFESGLQALATLGRAAPCPTCSGPSRETVGMVCQTCGTDYAAEDLPVAPGGGLLPGPVVSASLLGAVGGSDAGMPLRGAGASSGPSPRLSQRTPDGNGVRRGAGPGVLGPQRQVMPGTAALARSINEALARRSR